MVVKIRAIDESKLNDSPASCASVTCRLPSSDCFLMTFCFVTGTTSFDDIPVTETLNHLTANRAKVPQKRPPSKVLYHDLLFANWQAWIRYFLTFSESLTSYQIN